MVYFYWLGDVVCGIGAVTTPAEIVPMRPVWLSCVQLVFDYKYFSILRYRYDVQ